ncbi:uncharacterized protein LOC135193839, partial [Vanessa tameamea]|uniref:Uncharacterized protein LOC135193839 n=1 Tax=Vanessa tameamea TaxID=334116 RepID=A0ABM4ARR5_VANTA
MGGSVVTAILVRVPADTLDELRKAYPGAGGTTWTDLHFPLTRHRSAKRTDNDDMAVEVGAPKAHTDTEDLGADKGHAARPERLSESDSSVCSMMTVESVDIPHKDAIRRKGEKRTHAGDSCSGSESDASEQLSENSESSACRWLKPANKRGRGRPPTHGKYVGLGKSRAELQEAKSKTREDRFQAEDTLAAYNEAAKLALEERAARSRNRQAESHTEDAPKTSAALDATVQQALDVVLQALKTAADTIKGAVAELRALTMSEEVARLEAANAQLSGQLAELRREVAQMRAKPEQSEENLKRIMEEALRCSREQFSNMLNARMEGIERRLLPEPRLRPPLAADRKAAEAATATPRVTAPVEPPTAKAADTVASSATARRQKKGKRPSMAAQEAAAAAAKKTAPPPASRPGSSGTSWAAVVRQQPSKPPKKPKAAAGLTTATRKGKKEKRPERKLRSPRTAVITITLKPGAEEKGLKYETVLQQAKSRIKLSEVGLTAVRFRTAATGARMLEIPPGTVDAEKSADALAAKLRDVLSPDEVQVHRPTKCVEIRVMDLDDSVTSEEVVAAVATEGGCSEGAIRPGVVVRGANGCRSLWLSCPVAAAKKILVSGRIRVGGVDRSRLCFRCGQPDHKARECTAAEANCILCSAAGKPATHALGMVAEPYVVHLRDDWVSDHEGVISIVAPAIAGAPAIDWVAKGRGCVAAIVQNSAFVGVYASPNRSLAEFEQLLVEVGALVGQVSPRP